MPHDNAHVVGADIAFLALSCVGPENSTRVSTHHAMSLAGSGHLHHLSLFKLEMALAIFRPMGPIVELIRRHQFGYDAGHISAPRNPKLAVVLITLRY